MPDSGRPSLTEQIDEDEAWLAAKYAANPFNGARPPALGDSSPLFDYGR